MKINDRFKLKKLNKHNVIVDENDNVCATVDFNDVKIFLWQLAQNNEVTKSQMLNAVLKEFDISTVLALGEIDGFIKKLKEMSIIK